MKASPLTRAVRVDVAGAGEHEGQDAEDALALLVLPLHLEQLLVAGGAGHAVAHHEQVVALRAEARP